MNRKSGRTTIYDVAKEAGVSPSTVSKVLSDPDNTSITFATRAHVLSVAEKLHYSRLDRIPPEERDRKRIAVIIPNLMNPYYAPLISGIEAVVHDAGMLMVLYNSRNNPDLEVRYANQIRGSNFVGLIIASICNGSCHIKRLMSEDVKVVALEQKIDLPCSAVYFNYEKGARLAVQHLLERKRERIAFLSSPLTRSSRKQVFSGYKNALHACGKVVERDLVRIAKEENIVPNELYEYRNGTALIDSMLDANVRFDSVFCINDITAIGALQALSQRGVPVPDQVSVVGFDNILYSEMITPRLTTIEQSGYELGSVAADLLLRIIKDRHCEDVSILLEPKLVVRDST